MRFDVTLVHTATGQTLDWTGSGHENRYEAVADAFRDLVGMEHPVTIFGARPVEKDIEAWAEAGVQRCLFMIPSVPASETIDMLKKNAEFVKQYG